MPAQFSILQLGKIISSPNRVFQAVAAESPSARRVFFCFALWLGLLPPVFADFGTLKFGWRLGVEPVFLPEPTVRAICIAYFGALLTGFLSSAAITRWMAATDASQSLGRCSRRRPSSVAPLAVGSIVHLHPHALLNVLVLAPVLIWSMYLLYRGIADYWAPDQSRHADGVGADRRLDGCVAASSASPLQSGEAASARGSVPSDALRRPRRDGVTYCPFSGIVGTAAGVYVAAELIWPTIDPALRALSIGRLRTTLTTLVLFGFGVSASSRPCLPACSERRMSRLSHRDWPGPCSMPAGRPVLGAVPILAGWNAGKEYAEPNGHSTWRSPPLGRIVVVFLGTSRPKIERLHTTWSTVR